MTYRRRSIVGLLIAPAVAVGIAVSAEFADLGPPVLLAVAVPAMIVSTLSAGYLFGVRPIALVLVGGLVGLLTFTISEGGYLAIHYSRGGTFHGDCCHSQAATAAVLFGIHVWVGTVVGLGVGAVAVALMAALRTLVRRTADEPATPQREA